MSAVTSIIISLFLIFLIPHSAFGGLDLFQLAKVPLEQATTESTGGSLDDLYENGEKWVAYISATVPGSPFLPVPSFTLAVDLADYWGMTEEGQDGWVTVWLEPSISIGAGGDSPFGPVAMGFERRKFDLNRPDQRADWRDLTLAVKGGFTVASLTFTDSAVTGGVDANIDLTDITSLISPEAYGGLSAGGTFSFSGVGLEIRKSFLEESFENAFLPGVTAASYQIAFASRIIETATGQAGLDFSYLFGSRFLTNADRRPVIQNGWARSSIFTDVKLRSVGLPGFPNELLVKVTLPAEGAYEVEIRSKTGVFQPPWAWTTTTQELIVPSGREGDVEQLEFKLIADSLFEEFQLKLVRNGPFGLPVILEKTNFVLAMRDGGPELLVQPRADTLDLVVDPDSTTSIRVGINQDISPALLAGPFFSASQDGRAISLRVEPIDRRSLRLVIEDSLVSGVALEFSHIGGIEDIFGRKLPPFFKSFNVTRSTLGSVDNFSGSVSEGERAMTLSWSILEAPVTGVEIFSGEISQFSQAVSVGIFTGGSQQISAPPGGGKQFFWARLRAGSDAGPISPPICLTLPGVSGNSSGITVTPSSVIIGGERQTLIEVVAKTEAGVILPGVQVGFDFSPLGTGSFRAADGQILFAPFSLTADENGVVSVFHRPTDIGRQAILVSLDGGAAVEVGYDVVADTAGTLALEGAELENTTTERAEYRVVYQVSGMEGEGVEGVPVELTVSSGSLDEDSPLSTRTVTTGRSGRAAFAFYAAESGNVVLTAEVTGAGLFSEISRAFAGGNVPSLPFGGSIPVSGTAHSLAVSQGVIGVKLTSGQRGLQFIDPMTFENLVYVIPDDQPSSRNNWDGTRILGAGGGSFFTTNGTSDADFFRYDFEGMTSAGYDNSSQGGRNFGDEIGVKKDGSEFALSDRQMSRVHIYNAAGSHQRSIGANGYDAIGEAEYTDSGDRLAFVAVEDNDLTFVEIWNTATWSRVARIEVDDRDEANGLAWSPDGQRLACAVERDKVVIVSRSGSVERVLEMTDDCGDVSFSPDGSVLACHAGNVIELFSTDQWFPVARWTIGGGRVDTEHNDTLAWRADSQVLFAVQSRGLGASLRMTAPFDTTKPTLSLLNPLPATVDAPTLTVSLSLADEIALAPGSLIVEVNGQTVPFSGSVVDGMISGNVSLVGGVNDLRFEVSDLRGNVGEAEATVTYDVPLDFQFSGTNCEVTASVGAGIVSPGTIVILECVPDEGHKFDHFLVNGNPTPENPLMLELTRDTIVVAEAGLLQFPINIAVTEGGSLNTIPTIASFEELIELNPTAFPGFIFTGWRGDPLPVAAVVGWELVVRAAVNLEAVFIPSSLVDSDSDGLPDAWEESRFESLESGGGKDDQNGNGRDDLLDYAQGEGVVTDLIQMRVKMNSDHDLLCYTARLDDPALRFQIEWSSNLDDWYPIVIDSFMTTEASPAFGTVEVATTPLSDDVIYYRLKVGRTRLEL